MLKYIIGLFLIVMPVQASENFHLLLITDKQVQVYLDDEVLIGIKNEKQFFIATTKEKFPSDSKTKERVIFHVFDCHGNHAFLGVVITDKLGAVSAQEIKEDMSEIVENSLAWLVQKEVCSMVSAKHSTEDVKF